MDVRGNRIGIGQLSESEKLEADTVDRNATVKESFHTIGERVSETHR
ncbi:hypothetical protein [Halocatena marina]|nr:hypothetical protein [Halocatena marina]